MLGTNVAWINRRLSLAADVELTFEDAQNIAQALNVPVQRLVSAWLPRLDSNQKPAGYPTRAALTLQRAA